MRIIIFAVVLVAALLTVNCAKADDIENANCVLAKRMECNIKFKALVGKMTGMSREEMYCAAMQGATDCVLSQIHGPNNCTSLLLRKYYLIVLVHTQVDKGMSFCPIDVGSTDMKSEVIDDFSEEFEKYVPFLDLIFKGNPPNYSQCAQATHQKCAQELTDFEEYSKDLCKPFTDYIKCYQENKCANDPLSEGYAEISRDIIGDLIEDLQSDSKCKKDK